MITRKIDYAIRAMLYLAAQDKRAVSASSLAEAVAVPYRFLRAILLRLVKAGLLQSTRGKNGGLSLAKAATEISLLNIIRASDEKAMVFNRCLHAGHDCQRSNSCMVHDELLLLQQTMENNLENITLASLIAKSEVAHYPIT